MERERGLCRALLCSRRGMKKSDLHRVHLMHPTQHTLNTPHRQAAPRHTPRESSSSTHTHTAPPTRGPGPPHRALIVRR